MQQYNQWEQEIKNLIIAAEITNSEAQAILEANEFTLAQFWGAGKTAKETADKILITV